MLRAVALLLIVALPACSMPGRKVLPFMTRPLQPGDVVAIEGDFPPANLVAIRDAVAAHDLQLGDDAVWRIVQGRPDFGAIGDEYGGAVSRDLETIWLDGSLTPEETRTLADELLRLAME